MGRGKKWSEFELNYLDGNWGKNSLAYLSVRLKRTEEAIIVKAKRLKLGASTKADEYLTANQISVLLNIESHTVLRWIKKHNLKAVRKILFYKREFILIKHCDLCEWLKNNQDRFDSRKIEFFGLGYEPEWLKLKREKDKKLPKNRFKNWTAFDIQRIINLSQDMTYKEIAKKMGRSHDSIERKFGKLKYESKISGVA